MKGITHRQEPYRAEESISAHAEDGARPQVQDGAIPPEMVERVAKAIWEDRIFHIDGEKPETWPDHDARWCRAIARTAMEAMRKPTKAMTEADPAWKIDGEFGDGMLRDCWQAMIDAALSKEG